MKRARFYLKAAFAMLLVAVLGAGAALVAVKVFFPEPRARAWFVDAARRQLGRDVRLERIDVGLRGLNLHGLEVAERPGFAAGTFLRVEDFRLRPSWRALLKRRLVVAAVAADGLTVRVVEGADGRFNYETLTSSAASAARAPSSGSGAAPAAELELKVRRAQVSNGTVEYAGPAGSSWTLTGLDLDVSDFGQAAPFGVETSFEIRGRAGTRAVDARVAAEGTVDLARGSRAKFAATVKKLVVEQQGLSLAASGAVARLDAPELVFNAALSAAGREFLQAGGTARFGAATTADLRWKTPGLDTRALAPLAGVPAAEIPAAEGAFAGSLNGGSLTISTLTAKAKEGTVSASGALRALDSAKPVPDLAAVLALDLPAFRLSELPFALPSLKTSFAVPAGRLEGGVRLSGDDVRLEKVSFKTKGASVVVNGIVARALAGAPAPDLSVTADLTLPALTESDLPFPGATPGLRMPSSRWTADFAYSPRLLRIKSLRAASGRNDVEASGTVADPGGRAAYDLLFKCRSFYLQELTQLTPRTRESKLAGSGFFAFSMTGTEGKPVYAGKGRFKDAGARVAGLELSDFSGTASFDAERVDLPDLTGKLAGGLLKMDLNVKNYAVAPDIELEASLDRFDLGRYLAAKTKIVGERAAARSAKSAASGNSASSAAKEKKSLVSTRGHLRVGTLIHPNATVTDVKVGWDLRGVGADFRDLNGEAQLHVGGGRVRSVGDMAEQSKLLKVLLFPLLIVQKLGSLGGLHLFPDFNDITVNQIAGDYGFQNGVMTLRQSEMDSDAARVSAKGTIDLPAELLDLVVTAQVGRVAPIDIAVTGTFEKPKTKVNLAKFLATPAQQLLQGLFGK